MTRQNTRIFISCWIALTLGGAHAAGTDPARTATITILHTNDIHGHLDAWKGWEGELKDKTIGGLDRLAARVREQRATLAPNSSLLLDAGDTIGDTMIADETEGRAIIETMNAMGYDAMVVGNHEPDYTAEKLRTRIGEARFPVLAANIQHRWSGKLFTKPYVIKTVNGIKVGILGIAYPNTPLTTATKNVKNLRFSQAVPTAQTYVQQMRDEGAQIVIALTHLGINADKHLAEKVDGIDVIVGGHSHNRMKDALKVRQTLIVQAGAHGSDLGRLDLNIANGKVASFQRTLISVTGPESDSGVASTIAQQKAPFEKKMTTVVGNATSVIPRVQTIAGQEPAKRDGESPADDLFADAVRESTQTQIAFLPGVGYGVALQPGNITAADLRNLIPHDSAVWTMRLTGGQIRDVLEQSIENVMTQDTTKKVGGMIQVSGLQFSYKPDAPFSQRVQTVTVAGKPLEFARYYAVATNALLAQGGHNYVTFKQGRDRKEGSKQFDLVKSWIAARGNVAAPPTDRITKIEGK